MFFDSLAGLGESGAKPIAGIEDPFRENTGLSVHRYVTKKRFAACAEAMRSGRRINEICGRLGFLIFSIFRAFLKRNSCSPSAYLQERLSCAAAETQSTQAPLASAACAAAKLFGPGVLPSEPAWVIMTLQIILARLIAADPTENPVGAAASPQDGYAPAGGRQQLLMEKDYGKTL